MRSATSMSRTLAFVVTTLLLAACGQSDPTGPGDGPGDPGSQPPAVASIRVIPGTPELVVGQSVRLVATPLSAHGQELDDRPVAWQSADTSKAVVDTDGVVTAVAAGSVPLTVTSETVSQQVVLTVLPVPPAPPAYVWLDAATLDLVEGEAATIRVEVRDSLDRPLPGLTVTWTSMDGSVVTVDGSGRISAVRRGSTYVIAKHGTLEAAARVDVREDLAADVVYHIVDTSLGVSRAYRADPNDPNSPAQAVFGEAGTWQITPSPDGSRLAFACTDLGPAICVSNADGSGARALTTGDLFYEDHPTWSPDGQRIAFRRWSQIGTPGYSSVTDVWVMNADGSDQVNVTNDGEMQHDPAWSPVLSNGTARIAYSQSQLVGGYLVSRLFTMAVDGSDRRAETPMDGGTATEPAWSPDGTRIVYVKNGSEVTYDLWVTRVGLQLEAPLMDDPLEGEQGAPAYSPDGRYVLFTSAHEPTGPAYRIQLYTVRADGSDLRRRTEDPVDKYAPAWIVR